MHLRSYQENMVGIKTFTELALSFEENILLPRRAPNTRNEIRERYLIADPEGSKIILTMTFLNCEQH